MIDIILPTYNGETWIRDCLDSIVSQTYKDWALFIIDDGSSDNTLSIVNEYIDKHGDDKIKVYKKKGIRGAPSSRMEFLNYSSSKYIAFIDQDDFWHSKKLELQLNQLELENVDLVFSNIFIVDKFSKLTNKEKNENARRMHFDYTLSNEELSKIIFLYCPIRIGTVVLSRESFIESGGFDLSLTGGEDWEFWVRYVCEGNRISLVARELAFRRVHGENTSVVNRIPRLTSWISAAEHTIKNYPHLKKTIATFYHNTYLKSLVALMKEDNKGGVILIHKVFDGKVSFMTKLKGFIIVKFWFLNQFIFEFMRRNYRFFLSLSKK